MKHASRRLFGPGPFFVYRALADHRTPRGSGRTGGGHVRQARIEGAARQAGASAGRRRPRPLGCLRIRRARTCPGPRRNGGLDNNAAGPGRPVPGGQGPRTRNLPGPAHPGTAPPPGTGPPGNRHWAGTAASRPSGAPGTQPGHRDGWCLAPVGSNYPRFVAPWGRWCRPMVALPVGLPGPGGGALGPPPAAAGPV